MHTSSASYHEPEAYQATTPELQGDHPETADVNSEPSVVILL
jgi:hypothetical protein